MTRRSLLCGAWLRPPSAGLEAWVAPRAGADRAASQEGGAPAAGVVRLDRARCLAFCAICVERCPVPGALTVGPDGPRLDARVCDGCGRCIDLCPSPGHPLSRG